MNTRAGMDFFMSKSGVYVHLYFLSECGKVGANKT